MGVLYTCSFVDVLLALGLMHTSGKMAPDPRSGDEHILFENTTKSNKPSNTIE